MEITMIAYKIRLIWDVHDRKSVHTVVFFGNRHKKELKNLQK